MNMSMARLARNQLVFREVNERLREIVDPSAGLTEYLCECTQTQCRETIALDLADYHAIRSKPKVFLIVPGHERLEVERVVEDENDRFMLVEKVVLIDNAEFAHLLPRRQWGEHHGLYARASG
jgi:hypothetical protein